LIFSGADRFLNLFVNYKWWYVVSAGVYANESGLKEKLDSGNTYDEYEVSDLTQNKAFYDDLAKSDFEMRVRLVIVYGRLKIGSVRSAFEDSIGSRIKKFNGQEDKPLLERFGKHKDKSQIYVQLHFHEIP
jgi:hypothetical protein